MSKLSNFPRPQKQAQNYCAWVGDPHGRDNLSNNHEYQQKLEIWSPKDSMI